MKKIYIASPYSDPDPEVMRLRYRRVCKIVAELMEQYPDHLFFSPIAHSHGLAEYGFIDPGHETWMWVDKAFMNLMDEVWIVAMQGRYGSDGIKAEIQHAKETNKPVRWM